MTDELTPLPTSRSDAERWGQRVALMWMLVYAGLIVLVSLFPSEFRTDDGNVAWRLEVLRRSFTTFPRELHSLRDLATNFILYVPLGVLAAMVVPGRGWARWLGLLIGAVLSAGMETAQIFTTRYPSFWDLLMNAGGHVIGFVVVARVRARRGLTAAIFVGSSAGSSRQRLAGGLRQVYVPLFGVLALLPFNITVSFGEIWAKLSSALPYGGTIWLSPLGPWPGERLVGLVTALILFLPYGFLSAVARPQHGRRAFVRYALFAVLICAGIELAQLFVRARSTDAMQPVFAALGAILGVALARLWDRSTAAVDAPGTRAFSLRDGLLLAVIGWCLLLVVVAWEPFTFATSWKEAARRLLHETEWLPLHAYVSGQRSLAIWKDLGREAAWYLPLGVLLQAYFSRWRWRWRVPRVVVAGFLTLVVATVLELGQAAVIGRVADTTDIVTHCLGAGLGYLLLSALRRSAVES
jgi:glycopeptide antibiotics resistance protein